MSGQGYASIADLRRFFHSEWPDSKAISSILPADVLVLIEIEPDPKRIVLRSADVSLSIPPPPTEDLPPVFDDAVNIIERNIVVSRDSTTDAPTDTVEAIITELENVVIAELMKDEPTVATDMKIATRKTANTDTSGFTVDEKRSVPQAIVHLPQALIDQAMKHYTCFFCKKDYSTNVLLTHRTCDDDCVVCMTCAMDPRHVTMNASGVETFECPGCHLVTLEADWPNLFEHITDLSASEAVDLTYPSDDWGTGMKSVERKLPPPVPPRADRPLMTINPTCIHRKRDSYYQAVSVTAFGLPFTLSLPSKNVRNLDIHDAIEMYVRARGLINDSPAKQFDPLTADMADELPYKIYHLASDGRSCSKCLQESATTYTNSYGYSYSTTYTACTGCTPIPADSEPFFLTEGRAIDWSYIMLTSTDTVIAVTWHDESRLDAEKMDHIVNHESRAIVSEQAQRLTLESCLQRLTHTSVSSLYIKSRALAQLPYRRLWKQITHTAAKPARSSGRLQNPRRSGHGRTYLSSTSSDFDHKAALERRLTMRSSIQSMYGIAFTHG